MVKFIIEVSESYINDHASQSLDNIKEKGGAEALDMLVDKIAFELTKKRVDNGETELVITREDVEDRSVSIFDATISRLAMLAGPLKKTEV